MLPNDNNADQEKSKIWQNCLDKAKFKLITNGKFPCAAFESDKIISEEQAFEAMILFLEDIFEKTNSDDIAVFLSELLHGDYGSTSDPAAWEDWQMSSTNS